MIHDKPFVEDTNSLIITIGAPGSGKSTWADEYLSPKTLRLERDRFREALFGSRRAYHNHPLEHEVRSSVITHTMLAAMHIWPHRSWAVTDTGLRYESVAPFIEYAEFLDCSVQVFVFERSADYLRTCNRIRPHAHRIPEDILEEMIEQVNNPDGWWWDRPWAYA